mmetsp:Transcript_27529/g.91350  ORF Transcript_27529/g.91350 Transcript_27529/m.91350 type:complete len:200 (-) Transcript_27529:107-706(-)
MAAAWRACLVDDLHVPAGVVATLLHSRRLHVRRLRMHEHRCGVERWPRAPLRLHLRGLLLAHGHVGVPGEGRRRCPRWFHEYGHPGEPTLRRLARERTLGTGELGALQRERQGPVDRLHLGLRRRVGSHRLRRAEAWQSLGGCGRGQSTRHRRRGCGGFGSHRGCHQASRAFGLASLPGRAGAHRPGGGAAAGARRGER